MLRVEATQVYVFSFLQCFSTVAFFKLDFLQFLLRLVTCLVRNTVFVVFVVALDNFKLVLLDPAAHHAI